MDIFQRRYYRLNIRLLELIGLWPYQDRKARLLRAFIVNGIVGAFCIIMIFQLFIANGDSDIVIDIITMIMAAIDVYSKYHTYYLNLRSMRTLLDNMLIDWKMWTAKEEIEIMKRYADEGRFYTLSYLLYVYISTSMFVSLSLVPALLDKIIPLNESRVLKLPVPGYYYLDQSENFYLLYCPMSSIVILGMTVFIAVDTQFFVFICHLCGVFSVVGFRLGRSVRDDRTKDLLSSNRYEEECFQYIALSIRGHKRAVEFASIIESSFSYPLLLQCTMNVTCLSMSLYRITVLMSLSTEVVRYMTFVAGQLFHIFFTAYFGQRIIDHSSQVFVQAYNGPWYETPLKIRKLLVLVMRRSLHPMKLTAGKMFIFSMEGFLTLFAFLEDFLQNVLHPCDDMDIFESPYHRLNNRLLSLVGLWPYQDQKSRLLRRYVVISTVASFSLSLLLKIFTCKGDIDIIMDTGTVMMAATNVAMKYYTYYAGAVNIRTLLDNMVIDWRTWTAKEELEILEKHAKAGRLYTLAYAMYIYVAVVVFLSISFIAPLMDLVSPLNASRPIELPTEAEYFVDQEKYFNLIYLHMAFSITIGMTAFIAADTQLFVFICHLCAVFSVVGFRLENLLKDESSKDSLSNYREDECFKYVALSIKGHRRAIEFANLIESSFSYPLFIQCGINIAGLSISLYRITVLLSFSEDVIKYIAFLGGQLSHVFCMTYFGQQIIDYSGETFFKAYSGPWYKKPIRIHKLLLLVMRRSIEPMKLTAGKIFVFSLEGFSAIVQTSTSYFMVLLSVR